MISYDTIIAAVTVIFAFEVIPQIIRNMKYRDTITQSIIKELIHISGLVALLIVYIQMGFTYTCLLTCFTLNLRFLLLAQIILWRHGSIKVEKYEDEDIKIIKIKE